MFRYPETYSCCISTEACQKRGGTLLNNTLQFYNILEYLFLGKILHLSTFGKKKKKEKENPYLSQSITNSRFHSLFFANGVDGLLFTI